MKKYLAILISAFILSNAAHATDARYIFYFIGDGMGMGHVNATETYLRDVRKSDQSLLMMTFPVASQVRTYSANNKVTDSAAAGTALSTGNKTNNGMVGMNPEGDEVFSISKDFLKAGYEIGVATTVAGDDATPAAFYAHSADRGSNDIIAPMAAESGFRFLGAGKFRGMTGKDGNPTTWEDDMRSAGYTIIKGYKEYEKITNYDNKILLLSSNPQGDQVGYTIDSIPGALTAAQITRACLNSMEAGMKNPDSKGFFMMMEGGNIDWAAHANDGGAVIKEVLNFQQAIDIAYQFYLQHPEETLIVVTADHDTGGMAMGREDNRNDIQLGLFDFQKISKDRFSDYCKAEYKHGSKAGWNEMESFLKDNFGFWSHVPLTEDETADLKKAFDKTFVTREAKDQKTWYQDFNHFTVKVYDILNRHAGIGWTTSSHTGNFVPLYAIGAGSELFKRNLNNTEVPSMILKAAGLKDR